MNDKTAVRLRKRLFFFSKIFCGLTKCKRCLLGSTGDDIFVHTACRENFTRTRERRVNTTCRHVVVKSRENENSRLKQQRKFKSRRANTITLTCKTMRHHVLAANPSAIIVLRGHSIRPRASVKARFLVPLNIFRDLKIQVGPAENSLIHF